MWANPIIYLIRIFVLSDNFFIIQDEILCTTELFTIYASEGVSQKSTSVSATKLTINSAEYHLISFQALRIKYIY